MSTPAVSLRNVNRSGILIRALIIMLSAGIVNAPSIFVTPLSALKGWDAEAVASAATLMGTFTVVGHFFGGILLSKIGSKLTTALGGLFICLAFVGTALVPAATPALLNVTYGAFLEWATASATRPPPIPPSAGFLINAVLPADCAWPVTAAPHRFWLRSAQTSSM